VLKAIDGRYQAMLRVYVHLCYFISGILVISLPLLLTPPVMGGCEASSLEDQCATDLKDCTIDWENPLNLINLTTKGRLLCFGSLWVAAIPASYFCGELVAFLSFTRILNRLPRKDVFVITSFTLAIPPLAIAFAPSFYDFLLFSLLIAGMLRQS